MPKVTNIVRFNADKLLVYVEHYTSIWRMCIFRKRVRHERIYLASLSAFSERKGWVPLEWFTYPEGEEVHDTGGLEVAYREFLVRQTIDQETGP